RALAEVDSWIGECQRRRRFGCQFWRVEIPDVEDGRAIRRHARDGARDRTCSCHIVEVKILPRLRGRLELSGLQLPYGARDGLQTLLTDVAIMVDAGERVVPEESLLRLKGRRSEEHTSELQSRENLVCRLLLE